VTAPATRWESVGAAKVDLNGHEAGNGGYSQGTPKARRAFLYSEIAHHRILAGREIPMNYGRNNNSPLSSQGTFLCYFNSLDDTVAYVSKDQYLPAMIEDVSEGIPRYHTLLTDYRRQRTAMVPFLVEVYASGKRVESRILEMKVDVEMPDSLFEVSSR
jgi:hypothetical protein